MASLMNSRVLVLFLITLTLLAVSSEARILPQFSTMGKKVNRELRLRELIDNVRNNETPRKRTMLGARLERVSPEGPDSQHH
ncbi:hypothetical protein RIF29_30951 [Crotalaria pallida]|uniref:Uncharacterized protein n=1 Tax=Crotalaria pallida TaxID=3830 RepID=A0AAN9EGZ2_CROPI